MNKVLKLLYFEEDGLKKFGWKEIFAKDQEEWFGALGCRSGDGNVVKVSSKDGVYYTTKDELKNYITMSYGISPEEVILIWSENTPLFEHACSENNILYKEGDGLYVMELCRIVTSEKTKTEVNDIKVEVF